MVKKVAINGFGRIGRLFFRAAMGNSGLEIISINDLFEPKYLAYALKFDTVFGRFPGTISYKEKALIVNGKEIPITAERDPTSLPHSENQIDVVVESTGRFTNRDDAAKHLEAGAKRVLISAPASNPDITVVMGCNDENIQPEHKIISNASCTTNCLGPVVKVLHENFTIKYGLMTTIHSYTNDQSNVDIVRSGDASKMIRGRACAANMIPTSTGAAKAIGEIFPDLKGKLDGIAVRVPTLDGSLVDLKAVVEKNTNPEEINVKMKQASESSLRGILEYSDEPIVSSDIIGNPHSSIFSSIWTKVIEDEVFILSYYDNEIGFSNRMVDLIVKKL
ncbi:MAG: type I glyceraldehyde-3-phosphate dehydrogenase [Candidatus Lokiarchaeota archaeon]|nr:type I glyceraldehyde-3-phosphate dehydrogenase [Candidatus Lokiarchaeota archaeon]